MLLCRQGFIHDFLSGGEENIYTHWARVLGSLLGVVCWSHMLCVCVSAASGAGSGDKVGEGPAAGAQRGPVHHH